MKCIKHTYEDITVTFAKMGPQDVRIYQNQFCRDYTTSQYTFGIKKNVFEEK